MTHLFAMATFAFVLSATPGPVNVLALASGLNHGLFRSFPFVFGATAGFTALLYMIGLLGAELVEGGPVLMQVMKVLGTAYILYMGVKLFRAKTELTQCEAITPRFYQGVILQWMNPKAWIACLSGIAAFVSGADGHMLIVFCAVYFAICFVGIALWAGLGRWGQRVIKQASHLDLLNKIMGLTLIGLAGYLLFI